MWNMSYSPLTNLGIEFRCERELIFQNAISYIFLQEYVFTVSSLSRFDERNSRRRAETVQNLRAVIRNQAFEYGEKVG